MAVFSRADKLGVARAESVVFSDIAKLCVSPGYIHALAYICFKNSIVSHNGMVEANDLAHMYSSERLIDTETNTLLGLLVREEVIWDLPTQETLQRYVENTYTLLEELHHCLSSPMLAELEKIGERATSPFSRGDMLREAIFYSGQSAYQFQYTDFALKKYAADAEWLKTNRGFTIEQARQVALAINNGLSDRMSETQKGMRKAKPSDWTLLPLFAVTAADVAEAAGLSIDLVDMILRTFSIAPENKNTSFNVLNDYNAVCSAPILPTPDGRFLLLSSYTLAEAIYDSPFYWMLQDKEYLPIASKHRGDYAESLVHEMLRKVFGEAHIYPNVKIKKGRSHIVDEIDTLVVWGNRAIIVQTKSKRLTIEARRGNDNVLHDDFVAGIQSAYDQAFSCAKRLEDKQYTLLAADNRAVELPLELTEIYVICVVSDHYPALSFQTEQFLKTSSMPGLQLPVVLDVFSLDVMAEMLPSPLHFLSYLNRRAHYSGQVHAGQELVILGYHLRQNLWMGSDISMLFLENDVAVTLDIAMMARRTGAPGLKTPEGILTHLDGTTLGNIVAAIEKRPDPATIELGFHILQLSGKAIKDLNTGIDNLSRQVIRDGKHHDLTFLFNTEGLTIHINNDPVPIAMSRLRKHCSQRKYKQRADKWFGICLAPMGPSVRFGVTLVDPWEKNPEMEEITKDLPKGLPITSVMKSISAMATTRAKVGRNQLCPCGSGIKFKRCCLK